LLEDTPKQVAYCQQDHAGKHSLLSARSSFAVNAIIFGSLEIGFSIVIYQLNSLSVQEYLLKNIINVVPQTLSIPDVFSIDYCLF
jgi:hypothetical protein